MDISEKREISLKRAQQLKRYADDFRRHRELIKTGMEQSGEYDANRKRICKALGASRSDWDNWKWQMGNRIMDISTLRRVIDIDDNEAKDIIEVGGIYKWAVSPYYCSLMGPAGRECPVRRMVIPSMEELCDRSGEPDPMREEFTNPAGTVTRRYPDRLIINVTNDCGAYCRFCQRRRNISCKCSMVPRNNLVKSIDYVRENQEIRDVLVTGGDPLTLEDTELEWIISQLRSIPHVEIIRIGTRAPVNLPQRITPGLCRMLKKYAPVYINTHFNHPAEICEASAAAAGRLADAGLVLGNQMVLLKGVNNDKYVVRTLNQELLKIRIRPYYIFHMKSVKGTAHFKCSIDEGMDIMEHLKGFTSGLAVPYYIMNLPGGLGKIPLVPDYIAARSGDYIEFRNWEGVSVKIPLN